MAEEQEMDINDNAVALDDIETPEDFQTKSVVDYINERYKRLNSIIGFQISFLPNC